MATKNLRIETTAGVNVYFVVFRSSDNLVFDFDDDTFCAISSAVEPYLAASEDTNTGGTGRSHYTASLDLSLFGSVAAFAQPYLQAGGSPAPLTDATLEDPAAFSVQLGGRDGSAVISGKFTPVFKRELDTFDCDFILLIDGVPTSFDGTGVLTIRDADGTLLFAALNSSPITDSGDSLKHLKFTKTSPGFTGDRYYSARLVLTEGSATFTIQDTFRMLA